MSVAAKRLSDVWAIVLLVLAVFASGETLPLYLRGFFVGDADEIIRAWYGRCAWDNANIIPYSHLSQPAWTAILAVGEGLARLLGLPFTLLGRITTVAFSWLCLRSVGGWVRAIGGRDWHAAAAVLLLMATPGFLLLSISVYPSVPFAALTAASLRALAEGRDVRAAAVIGWAPLVRWEGILIVALVGVFLVARKAWRALPWLLGPYVAYLLVQAARYGNPWKPLAYRTSKAMGAWLVWNPSVSAPQLKTAAISLSALWSPVILVGGLPLALIGLWQPQLRPACLGFLGLTVALLSIQHDFMVWPLRVFATPTMLGIMSVIAVASTIRAGRLVATAAALGVLVSCVMTVNRINATTVPPEGGFHVETGLHMFVRPADASDALAFLHTQTDADWIIVNHLNANLLRTDDQCSLYDLPLRLGTPNISLSRAFLPVFGLPEGTGLVVFHTLPTGVDQCEEVARFAGARQVIYRCSR